MYHALGDPTTEGADNENLDQADYLKQDVIQMFYGMVFMTGADRALYGDQMQTWALQYANTELLSEQRNQVYPTKIDNAYDVFYRIESQKKKNSNSNSEQDKKKSDKDKKKSDKTTNGAADNQQNAEGGNTNNTSNAQRGKKVLCECCGNPNHRWWNCAIKDKYPAECWRVPSAYPTERSHAQITSHRSGKNLSFFQNIEVPSQVNAHIELRKQEMLTVAYIHAAERRYAQLPLKKSPTVADIEVAQKKFAEIQRPKQAQGQIPSPILLDSGSTFSMYTGEQHLIPGSVQETEGTFTYC